MKKMKLYMLAFLLFLLFSSSAWVNITLVKPSVLVLPDYINNIAIIDRTKQEETPKNKLEQTLSGEIFHQDEQAVMQVTEGFAEACSGMNRFNPVRTAERYTSDGTKSTFPAPMDWDMVKEICDRHNTNAMLAVEIFDSDFVLTNMPVKLDTKDNAGKILTRLEYRATGVAVINFGVRLYDAVNQTIMDEYQTTHRLNFEAHGGTLQAALNQILDKVEAIKRASYDAGFIYGQRITPTYYKVTRYFFNRPKKALGVGVRYSEVADWKHAIDSWTKVVEGGKRKHAGRAAYNIAVAWEVLGDLEKAKEWAARSHTEFGEKDADEYYKLLNNRIIEENMVSQQITEK